MATRRDEIDILKALAIVAVVGIHVGASYFPLYPAWSPTWKNLVTLDQIFRFSVPLFVAISGYTLALKYSQGRMNLWEFFTRRVLRIFPWYLVFAGISFLLATARPSLWDAFVLGRADYHLYFVPMIFQLYLLFPMLLWLVKKWPAVILGAAFVGQVFLFQYLFPNRTWSDQDQYLFFGTWIFYFVLGIYLVGREKAWRWLSPVILASGLYWVINNVFGILEIPKDLIIATRFTKLSVMTYATGTILVGVTWGQGVNFLPKFIKRPLVWVGQQSYFIYLAHVLILRFVFEWLRYGHL